MHTDSISTVSTVLWESRADVDDRVGSEGDGKVEAASGAAATVWKEIRSDSYEGSLKEALLLITKYKTKNQSSWPK